MRPSVRVCNAPVVTRLHGSPLRFAFDRIGSVAPLLFRAPARGVAKGDLVASLSALGGWTLGPRNRGGRRWMSAQRPSFERREGGVDLRTLLRIVLRRWIVVVPTIIVAVLVGSQLLGNVKPDYEAKGSLLLLLPTTKAGTATPPAGAADTTTPDDIATPNPLLDLRASLDRTAAVFTTALLACAVPAIRAVRVNPMRSLAES